MVTKKKLKKYRLKKPSIKLDALHFILMFVIASLLAYIFWISRPLSQDASATSTTTVGGIIPEEEKDLVCNPCFSYFQYSGYLDGSLTLKNGDTRIEVTGVNGGRFIGKTVFDPGESLGITGIPTDAKTDVQIKYRFENTEVVLVDNATINALA
jgi:hypothetical protein